MLLTSRAASSKPLAYTPTPWLWAMVLFTTHGPRAPFGTPQKIPWPSFRAIRFPTISASDWFTMSMPSPVLNALFPVMMFRRITGSPAANRAIPPPDESQELSEMTFRTMRA
jgi:hypothetical protein